MKFLIGFVFTFILGLSFLAQNELNIKIQQIDSLIIKEKELLFEIEQLKLAQGIFNLKNAGYPVSQKSPEIKEYKGFVVGFDCEYKMAAWTFHQLTTDVIFGSNSRTNDFRIDSTISCGTAKDLDYFVSKTNEDGTTQIKGFGFDRGHLVPSADLKWSKAAMSETYYFSNITQQKPEFNRESWAQVEGLVRRIVDNEKKSLFVLTGPILHKGLEVNNESENKLMIPDLHYKIIADLSAESPRGMAFLMPNKKCDSKLSNYVVPIDSIERLTGLDFFSLIPDTLEQKIEGKGDFFAWDVKSYMNNVEPLNPLELPKGHFNTEQAASKAGSTVSIVGKVVSSKFIPKSQSTFLNLDKEFPNQIFSITIWNSARRNFSFKPETAFDGKYIVVTGKVTLDKNGVPSINVKSEEQIEIWEE
jgi:endonuclease G